MTAPNPETGWPFCPECNDAPAFARCPSCGMIPAHIMADLCREPLRQLAKDMCERAAIVDVERGIDPETGRDRVAA